MNKEGGLGFGSASIVLVFAVLCLTVFTLISLLSATTDRVMTDRMTEMVTGYYETDAQAETVLYEILQAAGSGDGIPETSRFVSGVNVDSRLDQGLSATVASFSIPMQNDRELHVEIAVYEDSYDILEWRMRDTGDWKADDSLPVWRG